MSRRFSAGKSRPRDRDEWSGLRGALAIHRTIDGAALRRMALPGGDHQRGDSDLCRAQSERDGIGKK